MADHLRRGRATSGGRRDKGAAQRAMAGRQLSVFAEPTPGLHTGLLAPHYL